MLILVSLSYSSVPKKEIDSFELFYCCCRGELKNAGGDCFSIGHEDSAFCLPGPNVILWFHSAEYSSQDHRGKKLLQC